MRNKIKIFAISIVLLSLFSISACTNSVRQESLAKVEFICAPGEGDISDKMICGAEVVINQRILKESIVDTKVNNIQNTNNRYK